MIKKIELTNYRLYSYFEKVFDEKLEIIQGRNGTGKSTIVEGIGYALQGSKVQKGSGQSWIKEGETNGGVKLFIDDFIIERHSNKQLVTHTDGKVLARGHTGINQWVEKTYGLTPELFTTSFYVRQKDVDSFSALSPMERTKRVEKLLRVDVLDKVKKSINEKLKYLKIDHSELTNKLSQATFKPEEIEKLKLEIDIITKAIKKLEVELKKLEAKQAVYLEQKKQWDKKVQLEASVTLEATESETDMAIKKFEQEIKKAIKAEENNKLFEESKKLGKKLGNVTQAKKYFKYSIEDLMNHKKLLQSNKSIQKSLENLKDIKAVNHDSKIEALRLEHHEYLIEIEDLTKFPDICKACGQDMPDKAKTASRLKVAKANEKALEKQLTQMNKEQDKYDLESQYEEPHFSLDCTVNEALDYVEMKPYYERYQEIKDIKFIDTMSLDYIEKQLETWRKHKSILARLEEYSGLVEPEPIDLNPIRKELKNNLDSLKTTTIELNAQEVAKAIYDTHYEHYVELGELIASLKSLVKFIDTYRKEFSENIIPLLAENVSKIMAYLTEDKYEEVVINKDYSIEKYDFYSGSEEDSVNFALRLAIAQISRLGTFNTMILDEIASSFDSVKEHLLLDILKTTDMQLIYISHGDIN